MLFCHGDIMSFKCNSLSIYSFTTTSLGEYLHCNCKCTADVSMWRWLCLHNICTRKAILIYYASNGRFASKINDRACRIVPKALCVSIRELCLPIVLLITHLYTRSHGDIMNFKCMQYSIFHYYKLWHHWGSKSEIKLSSRCIDSINTAFLSCFTSLGSPYIPICLG